MRPIDADVLLAVVETGRRMLPIPGDNGVLRKYLDWDSVKHLIERAPTIAAMEVVHGRWKPENSRAKSYLRLCSACGKIAYFCGQGCSYKYCPNCGAKMDGGAGDVR